MAGGQIIDLGYADPLDEPQPPPLAARFVRLRLIGAGVAALACLAALGGAATQPSPAFTPVGVIRAETPFRGRAPLLIAGMVVTLADGQIAAYHPDGSVAWRRQPAFDTPGDDPFYDLSVWGDSVMLMRATFRRVDNGAESAGIECVALDPVTGAERWRVRGLPERFGDVVMVGEDAPGNLQAISVYRSLPGELLWRLPPARTIGVDAQTDTLMTVDDDGLLTEYQLSTGVKRRTAGVRLPHASGPIEELGMHVFRDRVVLHAIGHGQGEPSEAGVSYDRRTFQPLPPSPVDLLAGLEECGPVLCAYTIRRPYILDRDTLAELWPLDPGGSALWTEAGLLLSDSRTMWLVDARTGQPLMDLGGWQPIYQRRMFAGEPVPALLVQTAGERTFVALLRGQRLRVLGSVADIVRECQSGEDLLVCLRADGHWAVWRRDTRM